MILMLVAALPERADIQASGMNASRLFKRANPLCLGCQAAFGRYVPTAVIDHVIPHKGDMRVFWDRSKWQPACAWGGHVVDQRPCRRPGEVDARGALTRRNTPGYPKVQGWEGWTAVGGKLLRVQNRKLFPGR
jgi:hypothetical protein